MKLDFACILDNLQISSLVGLHNRDIAKIRKLKL